MVTGFQPGSHELSRIYNNTEYNYIYLYHTGTYLIIPTYPADISEQQSATYGTTTPLGRSAPIKSYTGTGERSIRVAFDLHRDMMFQLTKDGGNEDDYIDEFIKQIQASVLPVYAMSEKMIDPPLAAMRIGPEIYIKGVVTSFGVQYGGPINRDDKYSKFGISFQITEVEPYDAFEILAIGSNRDPGEIQLDTSLDRERFVSSISTADAGSKKYTGFSRRVI